MAYQPHNDILYNACFAGYFAGSIGTGLGSGSGPASFTDIDNNAQAVAQNVDTAIANDNTISSGGGQPIAGSAATAAQTGNQLAKTQAMIKIAFSSALGRTPVGSAAAAALAAEVGPIIVAAYNAYIAQIILT